MRCLLNRLASSDNRRATTPQISSGRPTRPKAVCAAMSWLTSWLSRMAPPAKSVSIASNGVHGDASRTKFLCHVASQHLDPSFHGRISGVARQCESGEACRDVQNPAPILHQGQQFLSKEKGSLQMDVHQVVELL